MMSSSLAHEIQIYITIHFDLDKKSNSHISREPDFTRFQAFVSHVLTRIRMQEYKVRIRTTIT